MTKGLDRSGVFSGLLIVGMLWMSGQPALAGPKKTLTVVSGAGDGEYTAGALVAIAADAPPANQVFHSWTGATQHINHLQWTNATVTMPSTDITITATYRAAAGTYALTVSSGNGDGVYAPGDPIPIEADSPPTGQAFAGWTGTGAQYLADAASAKTTIAMPASSVTVTATFVTGYQLTVSGNSTSFPVNGLYAPGAKILIRGDFANSFQVFDFWCGGGVLCDMPGMTAFLDHVEWRDATVTMPAQNVTLRGNNRSATDTSALSVLSGSGDGHYLKGREDIPIEAFPDTPGQVFSHWEGDWPGETSLLVDDVDDPTTTLRMPLDPLPGDPTPDLNNPWPFPRKVTAVFTWSGSSQFVDRTAALIQGGTLVAGASVNWTDYNNDHYPDFGSHYQLWTSHAGQYFTPTNMSTNGGVWGDFDNDGDPDRFLGWGDTPVLEKNTPSGFQTQTLTFDVPSRANSSCWADFNNDGLIDLYVGGYEIDVPGPYETDVIVRNNGDDTFTQQWSEPDPQGPETAYPARGIIHCDFDEDGDQDVHVSNYRNKNSYLWRNNGSFSFTDVASSYGATSSGQTIGSTWGDLDNDGHFDLFIGNFLHDSPNGSGLPQFGDQSYFYRNLGPSGSFQFEDKTLRSGLAYQESYHSPALGDYDNDGDLDLFFTTIYYTNDDHAVLYRNDGGWRFTDVTAEEGLLHLREADQAAWSDFDNDGDLDLMVEGRLLVNGGGSGNHWLRLKLVGGGDGTDIVNRSAIGAQARITVSGLGTLTRQVEGGSNEYYQQTDPTLHFGLGATTGSVTVVVKWRNGASGPTCQETIPVDHLCQITYVGDNTCLSTCCLDPDLDGICLPDDNCPDLANSNQQNSDSDFWGDACDICTEVPNPNQQYVGDPTVTVTSPNGGEGWTIGSSQTISWTASDDCGGVASVDIQVSRNGINGSYSSLATGLANTGTLPWTVAGPSSTAASIKVVARDPANNTGSDTSNAVFSINCGLCVTDFCRDVGERCNATGTCGVNGCCNYSCVSDPSCVTPQQCPPNSCIGCN